ncbi:hypothetical protein K438DRAFT_2023423 [Mycena galopus ATCC 62051]|nr:hypothetical protein K438DRAFT_2023423 [Mycena galopus ATCC 62051]
MPSSSHTTMASNITSTPMCIACNWPPRHALRPSFASYAPQRITRPAPARSEPFVPLGPGLAGEPLPNAVEYVTVTPSVVYAPHFVPDVESRRRCTSQVKLTQPRGPRLQPVNLPPQITGVIAVALNPVLCSGVHLNVNFTSIPVLIDAEAQLATFPGLPSITLLCKALPWAIAVHASGPFVVVGDVLEAIRQTLAIPLTEEQVPQQIEETKHSLKRQRAYESGMARLHLLGGGQDLEGFRRARWGARFGS